VASHRDLSSPVPWRRSLRASRERRRRGARRRRLVLRGRAGVILAVALSALAAGGALAESSATSTSSAAVGSSSSVAALQRALGVAADGIYGPITRRAVRSFQRTHGLAVDGIAGPVTRAALGLSAASASTTTSSSSAGSSTLARIAQCESGGNPTAVSASGAYRGKYQFSRETWREMGGVGDPAAASEAEQDRIAARLLAREGTAPWPNCG
jgi:peptidoglycan hydrolase-like protein with peptidoglycan-binding domain